MLPSSGSLGQSPQTGWSSHAKCWTLVTALHETVLPSLSEFLKLSAFCLVAKFQLKQFYLDLAFVYVFVSWSVKSNLSNVAKCGKKFSFNFTLLSLPSQVCFCLWQYIVGKTYHTNCRIKTFFQLKFRDQLKCWQFSCSEDYCLKVIVVVSK